MRRKQAFHRTVSDVRAHLKAAGCDVDDVRVFAGRPDDCWGFWAPTLGVVVNPDLRGRALWVLLLHEFGHALGLYHSRKGVMHYRPLRAGVNNRRPTGEEKAAWVADVVGKVRRWRSKIVEESKLLAIPGKTPGSF